MTRGHRVAELVPLRPSPKFFNTASSSQVITEVITKGNIPSLRLPILDCACCRLFSGFTIQLSQEDQGLAGGVILRRADASVDTLRPE